ncbi:unnamed protein product, partial [Coregonus sp. 'balchen']
MLSAAVSGKIGLRVGMGMGVGRCVSAWLRGSPMALTRRRDWDPSPRYSTTAAKRSTPSFSYVIVGAGSAGCVLANRLTEDPQESVLLLEAGPKDMTLGNVRLSWKIHMPAALIYNLCDDKVNWFYHTLPQEHVNNRVMYWPRGRVWGGSSSLNAMVYIRGHAEDYNRWQREGAEGWDYDHCLPYFRKAQCHELGGDRYRGGSGPLHVSRGKTDHPLHRAFIEAGQQAGYPFTDDMNGFQQEGLGWMDMTIYKGKRWSTASAYLRPVLNRDNLRTEVQCLTTRILFDGRRAVGVDGGAINSPQLLMLSGVGNADDLKQLDIPVVQHLPGVGSNLQDHLELYVQQQCTQPITLYKAQKPFHMVKIGLEWLLQYTGYGATAHLESGGFIRSRGGVAHPDIQFHFLPSQVIDHGRVASKIEAYQIFAQKAFDPFRGPEVQPGPECQSDAEIDAFVRRKADSAYHPSCTCKMGSPSDPMAVVDPETRVLGLEGLRVVDASIMPSVVSGNLNAPTIMIAEKAADIIRGRPALSNPGVPVYQPASLETQR